MTFTAPHSQSRQSQSPETSDRAGVLQRKCSCGKHTATGGQCESCAEQSNMMQRRSDRPRQSNLAPPIVHEVIRSSGRSLDAATREFMEPRFGHDFSGVRVHTDAKAVESAVAVNAQAYTVGQHLVFGRDQYQPQTQQGSLLLAHELTHVLQQGSASLPAVRLDVGEPDSLHERQADAVAATIDTERSFPSLESLSAPDLQRQAEPDAATEETAENESVALTQPIVSQAPRSAISIEEFISLVRSEEVRYSETDQLDTKLMITRLRKVFYDRSGWDEHLIADAKSTKGPYTTTAREAERYPIEIPGPFNDIEAVHRDYLVTDRQGTTPAIASNQEVRLSDGSYIDLGHVFAGLDALNHPQMVDGPFTINITKNVDAVTWVGDLGSALAEAQLLYAKRNRTVPTAQELQQLINEFASPQDMLGNIDAYVIGAQFSEVNSGGRRVSEILTKFYLESGTPDALARERRFSLFTQAVGLRGWDGSSFSNEETWIDNYTDEVNDAAALYVGANTEGRFLGRVGAVLGMAMNQGAETLVRTFLAALKQHIANEP